MQARVPAPVLVAFDDTDSVDGGCTTRLVFDVMATMPEVALRGMPRLVRLNPNVPHKTRGNGAVVLELVVPSGPRVQIGAWGEVPVYAYPDGGAVDAARFVWDVVEARAEADASPAVVSTQPPSELLYWQALRSRVTMDEAVAAVDDHFGGRGVIGAAAACAWAGPATSYELLAYRHEQHIGSPRDVDEAALRALDADGTTFHSGDGDVTTCVPNTPCPVLVGLRGLDPERLVDRAVPLLSRGETAAGWMLFATNQASGDHVTPVPHLHDAPEWGTVEVPLSVSAMPEDRRGGHVAVACHDALGHPVEILAFEPTKSFRDVVRALRPDDQVTAVGAFDETIRLERLRVDRLADAQIKTANPTCPQCQKTMKSRGKDAGYRCPDGHGSAPEEAATRTLEDRTLRPGWYEVPVIARRHLHRPLLLETVPEPLRQ